MRISDWSSDVCSSDLVTKVQDRRLVRRTTTGQLGELAHRKTVVQRLFHRWVAQVEPLLHEVNPQHRLNGIRLATHLAFLRVVLGNLPGQIGRASCGERVCQYV